MHYLRTHTCIHAMHANHILLYMFSFIRGARDETQGPAEGFLLFRHIRQFPGGKNC